MTSSSLVANSEMACERRSIGDQIRRWRLHRRLSQLDLACAADISARHLSFVETGRSLPSREMILHLADQLEVPFRERNLLLTAGGFAPVFMERSLNDPAIKAGQQAISLVLSGHEPYPALAINRHWTIVASNRAIAPLVVGADPMLLAPPVNVLRLGLHPHGIAPRIANFAEWRHHLLLRLRHQINVTGDHLLVELMREISSYPPPATAGNVPVMADELTSVAVPLRLMTETGILNLISTTTLFGMPQDITLAEIAIESFFPGDAATVEALNRLAQKS